MKSILYVLSFYFVLLSVLPCVPEQDSCASSENSKEQAEGISTLNHESEEAMELEHCSPFCFCQLCRTVILCTSVPEFTFQYLHSSPSGFPILAMLSGSTEKIDKPPKTLS